MFKKITDLYRRVSPYFQLVLSVLYGLLIIFCFVGAFVGGGYAPVVGIMLVCLTWATARIMTEATVALKILNLVLKNDKSEDDSDDHS